PLVDQVQAAKHAPGDVGGTVTQRGNGLHDLLERLEKFGGKLVTDQVGETLAHPRNARSHRAHPNSRTVKVSGETAGDTVQRCFSGAVKFHCRPLRAEVKRWTLGQASTSAGQVDDPARSAVSHVRDRRLCKAQWCNYIAFVGETLLRRPDV